MRGGSSLRLLIARCIYIMREENINESIPREIFKRILHENFIVTLFASYLGGFKSSKLVQ